MCSHYFVRITAFGAHIGAPHRVGPGAKFPSCPHLSAALGIDRNVAWSFYSLNSDADDPLEYFEDENNQVQNPNFIFRTPSECQWMQCL